MDIRAILKSRNLDDANIEQLMTNPAYSSLLESFISEAENGKTALLKAQEIETNLKNWNTNEVVPYVRGADEKVAKMSADLAATRAHMKALKDAGYDIPDSYFADGTSNIPTKIDPPSAYDPKEFDTKMFDVAKTNMALISMSNKYRSLTGSELDLDTEYEDFTKNRRPSENLREYVGRKYDIAGLESKRQQAVEQKKLDDYAATKVQEEKTKWTQSNGVNPETRSPRATKFDQISKDEGRAKLWQTAAGREQATRQRLEKYSSLVQ